MTRKTTKFECAPTDILDCFDEIAREVFADILEIGYDECLVTDESCVCDFITDETPSDYAERFRSAYELDLPKHARVADLVREIARSRRNSYFN